MQHSRTIQTASASAIVLTNRNKIPARMLKKVGADRQKSQPKAPSNIPAISTLSRHNAAQKPAEKGDTRCSSSNDRVNGNAASQATAMKSHSNG